MKTKIYKDYSSFKTRKNRLENGVSEKFAKDHPEFLKENKTNIGCWNCIECESCETCIACENCNDCLSCLNSKRCVDCIDCECCENLSNVCEHIDRC